MTEVAEEFFEALQGNPDILAVGIAVFDDGGGGVIYERLGRVFGNLSNLSCIGIALGGGKAAIALAASMLAHIRQVEHVVWLCDGQNVPADDSSSDTDTDTACSLLAAVFDGNGSITSTSLQFKLRPDLAAGICQSMKGLVSLTEIALDCSLDSPVTVDEAVAIGELVHSQVKSLRSLAVHNVHFADAEASLAFTQAISQSALTKLSIRGLLFSGEIPLDVTRALTGSHLRELVLDDAAFTDDDLARSFCRALAGFQLRVVKLFRLQMHADSIHAFARSICRPCLEHLHVHRTRGPIADTIATCLQGAPNLQVLQIERMANDSMVHALRGCSHCPNLVELSLTDFGAWTVNMDEPAAECIRRCGRIVEVDFGSVRSARGNVWPSPAFLTACQAHRVVEEIRHPSACPELRAALALVTAKNKETRVHRSRFESLAGDSHRGRAIVGRALEKVKDKPHLIFLALTSNSNHLFPLQQG